MKKLQASESHFRADLKCQDSCDAYAHARTYTCSQGAKNSLRMDALMDGRLRSRASDERHVPPLLHHITPVSGRSLASTRHIPEKVGGANLSNQIMVQTQG